MNSIEENFYKLVRTSDSNQEIILAHNNALRKANDPRSELLDLHLKIEAGSSLDPKSLFSHLQKLEKEYFSNQFLLNNNQVESISINSWCGFIKSVAVYDITGVNILRRILQTSHTNTINELSIIDIESEDLPEMIGRLRYLVKLNIINNSLEKFPEWIDSLEPIEELSLNGNNSGDLPKWIREEHKLYQDEAEEDNFLDNIDNSFKRLKLFGMLLGILAILNLGFIFGAIFSSNGLRQSMVIAYYVTVAASIVCGFLVEQTLLKMANYDEDDKVSISLLLRITTISLYVITAVTLHWLFFWS